MPNKTIGEAISETDEKIIKTEEERRLAEIEKQKTTMGYTMKRGNSAVPFKELGSSPAKQTDDEKSIGGESLSELVTQGRVVNKPSKVEGGTDYKYKVVGKTKAGKDKIEITGEHGPEGGSGTGGEVKFD